MIYFKEKKRLFYTDVACVGYQIGKKYAIMILKNAFMW